MIEVGLTGNVAAGKSSVSRVWALAGVPVLDADALAHEVVAPGSEGLQEVVRAFGAEILGPSGEMDRSRMRESVFRDPGARARLEAILHPRIRDLRRRWVNARREEGWDVVVSEVPLLFEAGLENDFDVIVFIDAPEAERLRRLVRDRGIPEEEARRIMASQGDPELKRKRSHHVLANQGSVEELETAALRLLDELRGAGATDMSTDT